MKNIFMILSVTVIFITQAGCNSQFKASSEKVDGSNTTGSVEVNGTATAKIRILDNLGKPVIGALVSGEWSGVVSGSSSGVTDTNGFVSINSNPSTKAGTFIFKVLNVSKTGLTYDASKNKLSQNSISM